jgi:hypothetical protein
VVTSLQWRIAALVALFLTLIGAAIGWLLLLDSKPTPAFRTLVVTEYQSPFFLGPPFAEQDGDALYDCFDEHERFFERQESDRLNPAGILKAVSGEVAVLHFHSLAVCDGERVYLLPANARPDDPGNRLPLSDLLEAVDACPARHCLLLLDVSGATIDSRPANPAVDIAARVNATVRGRTNGRALVLCSCAERQRPLPAEPWAQSAFGHFLVEGLCGAADGHGSSGVHDGWIKVQELADYVTEKVDDWAWYTRRAIQTPVLLVPEGASSDFAVAFDARPTPSASVTVYPDWLRDRWALRDRWKEDRVFHVAPGAFRALESYLGRAERRCLGGRDPSVVAAEFESRVAKRIASTADAVRIGATIEPRSLAALKFTPDSRKTVAVAAAAVGDLLEGLQGKSAADRDAEMKKLAATWNEKLTPVERAASVFAAAVAVAPGKDRLRSLVALLPHENAVRFDETVLLERLGSVRDEDLPAADWRAAPFGRLIKVVALEEKAIAGNPIAVAAFQDELDKLSTRRRQVEVELVRRNWEAANRELEEIGEGFQSIVAQVQSTGAAVRDLEEVTVFLPACTPYVAARRDPALDDAWDAAVRSSAALFETLGTTGLPPREKVGEQLAVLRDALDILRGPFAAARVKELAIRVEEEQARPQDLLEIERLLDSPLPDGASRVQLAALVSKLAERLYRTMDGKTEHRVAAVTDAAGRPDFAAQLRRLAGIDSGVRDHKDRAKPSRVEPEQASESPPRQAADSPLRAARSGIATQPFNDATEDRHAEPTARLWAEHARLRKAWLARRYEAESEAFAEKSRSGNQNRYWHEASAAFFRRTANDYR